MLILPEELREEVRKPFGIVVSGAALIAKYEAAARPLITVGDRCCLDAIEAGYPPDIAIFDFKVKRVEIPIEMKRKFASFASTAFVVMSSAGSITEELEKAVINVLADGQGAVIVVGEDDLSSLLVMAHANEGTLIYGQPDLGAVVVPLGDAKIKEKARGILGKMGSV
jgi:uncharacterized protein (UPF0218 family)